jgi:energy-coupling factor transport system substrate-specific component
MKTEKLKGKDLINVGIYSAMYFVIIMVVAMLGYIPIFMPLLCVIGPILGGIPFMLFLTKVKKPGMILIMSLLMGILMLLTGMGYYAIPVGLVSGIIAELIYRSGKYKSASKAVLTYGMFSVWMWGNFIPLFFMPEQYFSTRQDFGQEYIDTLTSLLPPFMFPVLLVCTIAFGIVGGLVGRAVLKKHFIKAGIA